MAFCVAFPSAFVHGRQEEGGIRMPHICSSSRSWHQELLELCGSLLTRASHAWLSPRHLSRR
eukprot:12882410-Prorocentrum_lima.AAC.1